MGRSSAYFSFASIYTIVLQEMSTPPDVRVNNEAAFLEKASPDAVIPKLRLIQGS